MITTELAKNQFWQIDEFFTADQVAQTKELYRASGAEFSMTYDNRLLTDYNTTPEIQNIVAKYAPFVSDLVGVAVEPQVAYISIDLSGSKIMMHRLHPDILVQMQVVLGGYHDFLGYTMCTDAEINSASVEDYRTIKPVTSANSVTAEYKSRSANVFLNQPRAYVGMLDEVPRNHVREVLVMSYVASV